MSELQLDFVVGLDADCKKNLHFITETVVCYPAGYNVVIYDTERRRQAFLPLPTPHGGAGRITALAVHQESKKTGLVAVAVAHKSSPPTICVFEVETRRLKAKPIQYDSRFATSTIVCMCFSPNGKHLLSLTSSPTWVLTNWSWEKGGRELQSGYVSNKAGAEIYECSYCPTDDSMVCVVGNKILRFLHKEQNEFKGIPFQMKRKAENYVTHCWAGDRVLVATDEGVVLVVENAEFQCALYINPSMDDTKGISAMCPYSKGFVVGSDEGVMYIFEQDIKDVYKISKSFQIQDNYVRFRTLCVSPSEKFVACTLENSQMFVLSLSNSVILKSEDMNFEPLVTPFHHAEILDMSVAVRKPLIVTCGSDRTVRCWDYEQHTMEFAKTFAEQPLAVSIHPSAFHLLVAFHDSLHMCNVVRGDIVCFQSFPIKEVRCVQFSTGGQFFAAAVGATIQVFATYTCHMVGCFSGHDARVKSLAWSYDDSSLLSTSRNGTVIEWSLRPQGAGKDDSATTPNAGAGRTLSHVVTQLVEMKGRDVQVSDAVLGTDGRVYVTHVANSGVVLTESKEDEGSQPSGISGTLSKLSIVEHSKIRHQATVGTWSVDPSALSPTSKMGGTPQGIPTNHVARLALMPQYFRSTHKDSFLYSGSTGGSVAVIDVSQLAAGGDSYTLFDYKVHTGQITKLCLSYSRHLFACSTDGVISMFSVKSGARGPAGKLKSSTIDAVFLPPASEILVSKADVERTETLLRDLRQQEEELTLKNKLQLQFREVTYKGKLQKINEKYQQELTAYEKKYEALREEKQKTRASCAKRIQHLFAVNARNLADMDRDHEQKLQQEKARFEERQKQSEEDLAKWKQQLQELEDACKNEMSELTLRFDNDLAELRAKKQKLLGRKNEEEENFQRMKSEIEEDADEEIEQLTAQFDVALQKERINALRLKDQNAILKRKYLSLTDEIEENLDKLMLKQDAETALYSQLEVIEKDIVTFKKEIKERESTIKDKGARTFDLCKKNQELEKFRYVLDYKILELRRQIKPRLDEHKKLSLQIQEMETELRQYKEESVHLKLALNELKLKCSGMDKQVEEHTGARKTQEQDYRMFLKDLQAVADHLNESKVLAARVKKLYAMYVLEKNQEAKPGTTGLLRGPSRDKQTSARASRGTRGDVHQDYIRIRNYLERTVDNLNEKLKKDSLVYRKGNQRIMQENLLLISEINQLRRELQILRSTQQLAKRQTMRAGGRRGVGLVKALAKTDKASLSQSARGMDDERKTQSSSASSASMAKRRAVELEMRENQERIKALRLQLESLQKSNEPA